MARMYKCDTEGCERRAENAGAQPNSREDVVEMLNRGGGTEPEPLRVSGAGHFTTVPTKDQVSNGDGIVSAVLQCLNKQGQGVITIWGLAHI